MKQENLASSRARSAYNEMTCLAFEMRALGEERDSTSDPVRRRELENRKFELANQWHAAHAQYRQALSDSGAWHHMPFDVAPPDTARLAP